MKPVEQKFIVEGDKAGDCWRACLASILECDIELFPSPRDFDSWSNYYPAVLRTLDIMGYSWVGYTIENIDDPKILTAPDTDGYVIAVGKSPRSTPEKRINHAVVWKNCIIHDPHPAKGGIQDIITIEILTKKTIPVSEKPLCEGEKIKSASGHGAQHVS